MIPDKIDIKIIDKDQDGNPVEVDKSYYFQFNYNAINNFRKAEGLDIEQFAEIFSEVTKKEKDFEKMAKANEYFGKLFYHAVAEGQRKMKIIMDLSEADIQDYLNDPDNAPNTNKIAAIYVDSQFKASDKKKVMEAGH